MEVARDGGLWITGERGLGKAPKLKNAWSDYLPPESLQIKNLREPREDDEGGVTVVAESIADGKTVVARFDGAGWTVQPAGAEKIRRAWRSGNKALWVLTSDALFRQAPGETKPAEDQDISARQYFDMAMEPGGTFWLATSAGLFHYAPPLWRNPAPLQQLNSLVHCLADDDAGRLWFVADGQLHSLQGETHREFALPESVAHDAQSVHALFPLKDGTLLLDAVENSLRFNPDSGTFSPGLHFRDDVRHDEAAGSVAGRQSRRPKLEFRKQPPENGPRVISTGSTEINPSRWRSRHPPRTQSVLLHLFAARNGDLWLSGDQGMAWYHEKKWRTFPVSEHAVPHAVIGFTELTDGRIWCATLDTLWAFDGHKWSSVSGSFDHINALLCARDGSVWVADDAGVHRFFQNTWIENSREEGLPDAAVQKIFEDRHGNIWAGTPHGLSRYHPEADLDPPRTFIEKPDRETALPRGRLHFVRVQRAGQMEVYAPDRLLYSYKLDYRDWSPFTKSHDVSFSDLPAGRHVLPGARHGPQREH